MTSIVQELQRESYSSGKSISDLLRMALVVAKKLKVKEFEQWIDAELNGYKGDRSDIPDYREVIGEIKAFNPYNGWIPVVIYDEKMFGILSRRKISQPITQLEHLVTLNDTLTVSYPNSIELEIMRLTECDFRAKLFIGKAQVEGIIETVRNIVLNWALQLEEDGILGDDLSFSKEEKQLAAASKYNINHFHGPVTQSQIQQDSSQSTQTMLNNSFDKEALIKLIEVLKGNIGQVPLSAEEKTIFDSNLAIIEHQLKNSEVKKPIVLNALASIRNILEGATGSIIASGLIYQLGLFLSSN